MAIAYDVRDDGDSLVVTLNGRLDLRDVAGLRTRLLKCLAEQPEAVLVDLAGLAVDDPPALAVFAAVTRQAARWPGIPVLLCAPGPPILALLNRGVLRRLPTFHTVAAARDHVGTDWRTLPSLTDDVLPVSGAAQQARNVATYACLRWDLPYLIAPASLIASELVSNVVDHAHTMATLRLSLRPRYLNIAVQDGSPAEPVKAAGMSPAALAGRGLLLVEECSHSWGWLPTDAGKVVWASLARQWLAR